MILVPWTEHVPGSKSALESTESLRFNARTSVKGWSLALGLLFFALVILAAVDEVSAASLTNRGELSAEFRREIADPCLGLHWRLIVDPAHPGWPGRLLLLDQNSHSDAAQATAPLSEGTLVGASAFVVRAGAHVIVEQDTGVVRARLNGVALESAASGQRLRVRLILGSGLTRNAELRAPGPVISVWAASPGEVRWTDAEASAGAGETGRDR